MKRLSALYFVAILLSCSAALALPRSLSACSAFCLMVDGRPVCGQNYDWHLGDGLVFVNKRGLSKQGLVNDDNAAQWTSRFGSVTFNQYGREFPCGGMNEAGLVITISMYDDTRYPRRDARPAVNVPQWIQYQLDTAATVDEVIASDKLVRIAAVSKARVHFFVADRQGGCATIEFIRGKMMHHSGDKLPVRVLTNSSYRSSADWIGQFAGFGGERSIGGSFAGSRFAMAADRLRTYAGGDDAVEHCFATLRAIDQGSFTKWSMVYDTGNQKIFFHTHRAAARRVIDLAKCDFSPATPVKMLDMNAELNGEVNARLVDYSPARNRQVVSRTLRRTGVLSRSHGSVIERVCKYPDSCVIADKSPVESNE